jgi:hypothetical protein
VGLRSLRCDMCLLDHRSRGKGGLCINNFYLHCLWLVASLHPKAGGKMSNLLRSLSERLRTLVDIAFYSSLAALQFKLWLSVFDNLFRNGRLETEDVFVMFLLLLSLWFAWRRIGLPYASALLGIIWAAYLQSQRW